MHEGIPLLSKIPKFEHHSIASGGYHSVRSLTVLVIFGKWFELPLESGFNCPWKIVLIFLGKWFQLSMENGFNCHWKVV